MNNKIVKINGSLYFAAFDSVHYYYKANFELSEFKVLDDKSVTIQSHYAREIIKKISDFDLYQWDNNFKIARCIEDVEKACKEHFNIIVKKGAITDSELVTVMRESNQFLEYHDYDTESVLFKFSIGAEVKKISRNIIGQLNFQIAKVLLSNESKVRKSIEGKYNFVQQFRDWYLITYSDSDQKYAPFLDSSTILTNGLQTYDISEELNLAKRLTNEEETEDLIAWNIPFKVLNPAGINDELVNIINQLVIATRLKLWHYYK